MDEKLHCIVCNGRMEAAPDDNGCHLYCLSCNFQTPSYADEKEARQNYAAYQSHIMTGSLIIPSPLAIWSNCELHGWHNPPATFGEDMALIHSEVSEALEAYRRNEGDHRIAEELADIIIRVLHVASKNNLNIEAALWFKHRKNIKRPYRHGGKKL